MTMKTSPNRNLLVGLFFLAAFFILGVMAYDRYRKAQEPPPPVPSGPSPTRTISLFFPDEGWSRLVREGREIERCDDSLSCVREVLAELQNGPVGNLSPIFPEGVPLPSIQVLADTVTIDLSPEFVNQLGGGSAEELLTVYSLVNSITASFPEVARVRLTIDGKGADTLHGHVDIRDPLVFDPSLEGGERPTSDREKHQTEREKK